MAHNQQQNQQQNVVSAKMKNNRISYMHYAQLYKLYKLYVLNTLDIMRKDIMKICDNSNCRRKHKIKLYKP